MSTILSSERLKGIALFVQAVDAGSFALAAERQGLSRSAVGKSIARLETRLGVRLFHRTTRSLSLTEDGAAYHASCVRALGEIEGAELALAEGRQALRGPLRIDLPVTFGRLHVLPHLLELAGEHPGLSLDLSFSDRFISLADEGVDLAIRLGDLADSTLVVRRLAAQRMVACAAPAYLDRHGEPAHPDDLKRHRCVLYSYAGRPYPWRFKGPDGPFAITPARGGFQATNGEVMRDAVLAGQGLAQLPTFLVGEHVRSGRLQVVLGAYAGEGPPIQAVWPSARHLSPKVRAVVDRLVERFSPTPPWDQ